jgi:serine/threonine protein kinase
LESDDPKLASPTPGQPPGSDNARAEPASSPDAARAVGEAATALHEPPINDDPWLGRVLDERYRITERLGEGGMGAVFVAEHLKLHKLVALKVIRAELAGNGEVAARFAREAMATAQFEHPHVASAIDFGTLAEGGAYLVMQLVRGQSLRDLLEQRGKLPWPVACELLAQVADALSAARLMGVVHRDLKPENILVEVREDGSYLAKILDFGIAHVAPHRVEKAENATQARALTRVGTVMGTPGYMSPEQAVGDRVDHRTDLYALGVVLWECVAGRALWDGPDVTSIITRQLRDDVPRLRVVLEDVALPRRLDELVQRLCARAIEERPEHAGAVRDELRAMARHTGTAWSAWADRATHLFAMARARFEKLPLVWRALLAAAAAAGLLAALAWMVGQRPAPTAHDALTSEGSSPRREAVQPTTDSPSLAQRAMQFAERVVTSQPSGPAPSQASIPNAVASDAQTLLESNRTQDRHRAAANILAYEPRPKCFPTCSRVRVSNRRATAAIANWSSRRSGNSKTRARCQRYADWQTRDAPVADFSGSKTAMVVCEAICVARSMLSIHPPRRIPDQALRATTLQFLPARLASSKASSARLSHELLLSRWSSVATPTLTVNSISS